MLRIGVLSIKNGGRRPPMPSPASGGGDAVAPIFAPSTAIRFKSALPRIPLVGVPGRLLRIMRAVVDLDHHGLFVRDRRAMHVALGIAVETSGRENDFGR